MDQKEQLVVKGLETTALDHWQASAFDCHCLGVRWHKEPTAKDNVMQRTVRLLSLGSVCLLFVFLEYPYSFWIFELIICRQSYAWHTRTIIPRRCKRTFVSESKKREQTIKGVSLFLVEGCIYSRAHLVPKTTAQGISVFLDTRRTILITQTQHRDIIYRDISVVRADICGSIYFSI